MERMRVAVTGGSGRIGRFVVRHLVERGHQVTNLDHKQSREPAARFVYVDLTDRAQVHRALEDVDAVCHLGEIPSVGLDAPDRVYTHNTAAGAAVLQSAADLKLKRVIYTSSCQVYGCFGEPAIAPKALPFDETHPLLPQNAYSLSKVANETYARMIAEHEGISVAAFRFPMVRRVEPDDSARSEWRWLLRATGSAVEFGAYLHPDDAARAYVLAIENPRAGFEAYHFTAREVLSGCPISDRLRVHHPEYPELPEGWPAFKSPLSLDKAKLHFGWEPEKNVLEYHRKEFGADPHEPVAPAGGESERERRRR